MEGVAEIQMALEVPLKKLQSRCPLRGLELVYLQETIFSAFLVHLTCIYHLYTLPCFPQHMPELQGL